MYRKDNTFKGKLNEIIDNKLKSVVSQTDAILYGTISAYHRMNELIKVGTDKGAENPEIEKKDEKKKINLDKFGLRDYRLKVNREKITKKLKATNNDGTQNAESYKVVAETTS